MLTESEPDDAWSFRGGRQILEESGVLDELPQLAAACSEQTETDGTAHSQQLRSLGWEHEIPFEYTCPEMTNQYDEQETFTAYKDGVLVEHKGSEENARYWQLLKLEVAYRDATGFPDGESVNAGVVLLPNDGDAGGVEQIRAAINTRLANYFDFSVPLFVWQYPTD